MRSSRFGGIRRIFWSSFSDSRAVWIISTGWEMEICLFMVPCCCYSAWYFWGMFLTERWEPGTWMSRKNKKVNKLVFTVLIFSQMIFYTIGISMETGQVGSVSKKYGWHTQPLPLMSLLFLAELVVFFRCMQTYRSEKKRMTGWYGLFMQF